MAIVRRYDRAPLMLYWEVTRACDLACRHCRAEAIPRRDPRELSTEEGERLLESLQGFGEEQPHVVLTGGDPLRRPDLFRLIEHAAKLGLIVSVTPSGTPLCTPEAVVRIKESGARSVAFSLDGSTPDTHDRMRGVPGSFVRTLDAIRAALASDLPVQVNTLVAAQTAPDLGAIYRLVRELGVQRWATFFLITVGRGSVLREVTPQAAESILTWLYEQSQHPVPVIKTTEAHHFRRIAAQARGARGEAGDSTAARRAWGVRDGSGIMFISHRGDIYPSGFLPLRTGNVRGDDLVEIYRQSPVFTALRDPDLLKGKCGDCEYRFICGGSRARAYATSGDPLQSDPLCIYQPTIAS